MTKKETMTPPAQGPKTFQQRQQKQQKPQRPQPQKPVEKPPTQTPKPKKGA